MTRVVVLAALAGLLACTTAARPSPSSPPPPTVDTPIGRAQQPEVMLAALTEAMLDGWFARSPVDATAAGLHEHDDRWPDLSAAGRAETAAWIEQRLSEADAIPREGLDADGRLELDTIRNQLELARFASEVEQVWTRNPLAYASLISTGLDELMSREFAPIEQRSGDLAARLEGLPTLIDQALANLAEPEALLRPHAEVALAQYRGLVGLIRDEVPARMAEAEVATRERLASASGPAIAAIERLHAHVEAALPKARGEWRLGAQAFDRKLELTLQTELSSGELLALARAEHTRVRADMAALARELYVAMWGQAALDKARAQGLDDQGVVRAVLAELAQDHPTPEGLRDAAEANLARLDAFVRDNALVPIDPAEVLEVIWTPPAQRGVAIAGLAAPAPLDAQTPGLPSFYLVQPLPDAWSPELRESFLREYNTFMLEILSIHEAIPGHFVQLYWGKREPSKIRKVFTNGPFVEGWAVYTEKLMVDAGYAGAGPGPDSKRPKQVSKALWTVQTSDELRAKAIALHGLKFYLRTVTNAILDHEIHAGTMTREQAIALMVEQSFQERGEAEAKWTRAQLSSTQLSTYFVGAQAWFRLRTQAEARAAAAGQPFDLLAFHREALSHGAPPVHRLPELMGWE